MTMNLAESINVFEILAGGQGSGPSAPCPQCGPHAIDKGDIVKTKAEVKMYNGKTGNIDTLPPGTKMTVLNVLPKVGTGDQMVSVNTKSHDPEYMKLADVTLHKPLHKPLHQDELGKLPVWTHRWSRNPQAPANKAQDIQPVPKGQVISKFKTADGANVTWVRPSTDQPKEEKTLKEISQESHNLKGKFELTDSVQGLDHVTKIYETTGSPAHLQTGSNGTVYVHTYADGNKIRGVVIQEQNSTNYGMKTRGIMSFDYRNTAKAVGMLKSRYGIKTTLTRISKAKFGE